MLHFESICLSRMYCYVYNDVYRRVCIEGGCIRVFVLLYLLVILVGYFPLRTARAATDPVIAAAGDIACNGDQRASQPCKDLETSDLLLPTAINPDAVLALGDLQYEQGLYEDFLSYFDRSWGRVKTKLRPVPGNHEYGNPTCGNSPACGYFDYFNGRSNFSGMAGDRDKGYYAFTLGSWRIYAVNSNCARVSCAEGSPQERWLRRDLAEHQGMCQLMFMHHPYVASTAISPINGRNETFATPAVKPLWQAFYDAGGDVVLACHSHLYERFAPLNPDLQEDPIGMREFVVGTGGKNLWGLGTVAAGSQVQNDEAFGVLKLTLRSEGYDYEFVPIAGQGWNDAGTGQCHPDEVAPDTKVTADQSGLVKSTSATFEFSSTEPDSIFQCSLDGAPFAACASPRTYTGLAQGPHTFRVGAIDAAGNIDPTPARASWRVDTTSPRVTPPIHELVAGSALGTTSVPVRIAWSGRDATSGVARYQVQQRRYVDGAWQAWSWVTSGTTSTSLYRQLAPGRYQFRVRAVDRGGNWSAWQAAAAFSVKSYQEASRAITYVGSWDRREVPSAYGRYIAYASRRGYSATFSFRGSQVAWVAPRASNRGYAYVYLDGVKVATINLYSSSYLARRLVFVRTGLAPRVQHTLRVYVTGIRPAGSTGTRVEVDAFLVVG